MLLCPKKLCSPPPYDDWIVISNNNFGYQRWQQWKVSIVELESTTHEKVNVYSYNSTTLEFLLTFNSLIPPSWINLAQNGENFFFYGTLYKHFYGTFVSGLALHEGKWIRIWKNAMNSEGKIVIAN